MSVDIAYSVIEETSAKTLNMSVLCSSNLSGLLWYALSLCRFTEKSGPDKSSQHKGYIFFFNDSMSEQ
jgi:hypothetical protein